MKFAGFLKVSTVDYPGKMASTVFTGGCNYKCDYCHNPDLIEISQNDLIITEDEVIAHLLKRKGLIDALCITGGEPSLWNEELIGFIKRVKKELGDSFLIKIDTNGSNWKFLEEVKDIVDFIAMDFKALDYTCFSKINISDMKKSISCLKEFRQHELRITMYPPYIKEEDFFEIASIIKIADRVAIQQYNPKRVYKDKGVKSYETVILEKFKKILEEEGLEVLIRS